MIHTSRLLRFAAGAAVLTAVLGASLDVSAAPALRVQVLQHGDFALLGNALGHECAAGTPAPVVGTVGACGVNLADSAPDIFWRADSPIEGQAEANTGITLANARSTALLQLPAGATVTHAYLYWGASLPGFVVDTSVTLERPGASAFSQVVTATASYNGANNTYMSVADITSLVQSNGEGAYRLSGVDASNFVDVNNNNAFAGWWMVVLYERAADPLRTLAVFDGLDVVVNGMPQTATLTGFSFPNAGGTARLGVATFEGDNLIPGDQLFFNGGAALTDAANPATNFFNGTRSNLGSPVSVAGDLPQLTGGAQSLSGMDLDIVDVTAKLTAGQTSAQIQATSTGDVYFLASFVVAVSSFQPEFRSATKTATDDNGGTLLPGDVVTYSIAVDNTGNDTALGTVLVDVLPAGVTYVPSSLQITDGPNAGAKTDAAGDDQCDYEVATRTVTCRLGAGATAAAGGSLAIGASTTVSFQVTVDAATVGSVANQATITATGENGGIQVSTGTDSDAGTAGAQPTVIFVDGCDSDLQCMAPQPRCDTTQDPNVCVECLVSADCSSALLPTCDSSNVCVCVPTGAESCNGADDDCNGEIDEGFSVGDTCSEGLGVCLAMGTIICDVDGTSKCDAVAGTPGVEYCGDALDSDCDGDPEANCVTIDAGVPDAGIDADAGLDADGGVGADAGTNAGGDASVTDSDAGIDGGAEAGGCGCVVDGGAPGAPLGGAALSLLALVALRRRRRVRG